MGIYTIVDHVWHLSERLSTNFQQKVGCHPNNGQHWLDSVGGTERPANKRHEKKNTTPFNIRYYATIRNWQRRGAPKRKKNNKNSFFHSKAKAKTEIQYVYSQNDPTLCVLVHSQHNSHRSHYGPEGARSGIPSLSPSSVGAVLSLFFLAAVCRIRLCLRYIRGVGYSYV